MGRISAIQEQGAKARVVAMPSARLQYSFVPLHEYLVKLDKFLKSSVLRDQQRAIYGLCQHMDRGLPAFSTDLSSATDRFPRRVSEAMLEGMGLSEYAAAIEQVSSGTWESPWGDVSYGTGQPMGLYGSFPLFHLSNQMMADWATQEALKECRPGEDVVRFPNGKPFYTLGDDIVFSSPLVEMFYRKAMGQLDVPISEHKSYQGNLTEFAGFVVTKAKGKTFAFRPYKPPEGQRVTNPVDFLAAMGTKARVISPVWEKRVTLFSRTWSDRSPDLSPWVTTDPENPTSHWDAAVLDNEFHLLSEKYPLSVPALTPGVEYSTGLIHDEDGGTFTIVSGFARDKSADLPQYRLETSRERLGETPKHPRRSPSPLKADPLMRQAYEEDPSGPSPWRDAISGWTRGSKAKKESPPSPQVSPLRDSPGIMGERKPASIDISKPAFAGRSGITLGTRKVTGRPGKTTSTYRGTTPSVEPDDSPELG